jgi:hypothetical protein
MGTKSTTQEQFNEIVAQCRSLFYGKNKDYGTAWRVLRPASITDQILIKALRIRSIEEKGSSKIDEGIESEFKGIVNYGIIALIQLEFFQEQEKIFSEDELMQLFDIKMDETISLMLDKNDDYGEAWREMRRESFTDLILMKLNRTKQIEDNSGVTIVSEGLEANYRDMINYAIFALIRIAENSKNR